MSTMMKFAAACTAIALPLATVALPLTATAQSNDAAYCAKLTGLYRHTAPLHSIPNAPVPVAMAQCDAGDAAAGIPVLEQALKNEGMTLPPRS
jgi:hypothetical protein